MCGCHLPKYAETCPHLDLGMSRLLILIFCPRIVISDWFGSVCCPRPPDTTVDNVSDKPHDLNQEDLPSWAGVYRGGPQVSWPPGNLPPA